MKRPALLLAAACLLLARGAEAKPVDVSTAAVSASTRSVSAVRASTSSAVASSSAAATGVTTASAPPAPWILGAIAVSGNKNAQTRAILSAVKARKGSVYDKTDLDRDVQALIDMGNFDRVGADVSLSTESVPEYYKRVAASTNTVVLTFYVVEKPVIQKIAFKGNKFLTDSTLKDAMSLKLRDPLDYFKLKEDEQEILKKYNEKGFLDARVDSSVDTDTATLVSTVTVSIQEGSKSEIFLVTIRGVASFKEKKILKQMETNRQGKVYSPKDLDDDVQKVKNFYMDRGFLDVDVSSPTVWTSVDKSRVYIDLTVKEGRSYKFGDTTYEGNLVYTAAELSKVLEYRRGKVFNETSFEESLRGIQDLYAQKGRLKARVEPVKTLNSQTDLMDVRLNIVEGDIIYVDRVDVEGNKDTKTYVLRREVPVEPGDVFNSERIRKGRQNIMNLGFLDNVDIDIQPSPSDPDKVDLTYDVSEGKPGMLTAGAAYSTVSGLYGTLSLNHLNLFGRAQQASVQWSFGSRLNSYSLSWMTPWVDDHHVSLGVSVFNTVQITPFGSSYSAYTETNRGGTISVGPRFKDDEYQLRFSYTISQLGIRDVQTGLPNNANLLLTPGTSVLSALTVEFARDTRDYIYDPTSGGRNAIAVEAAGGPLQGDINFVEPTLTDSINTKILSVGDWPLVLTFANKAAYIMQYDSTKELPPYNRFFLGLGNQYDLRGYGPTGEVGNPLGGVVEEIFNTELGFPLAREHHKTIVKLVGFFDVGSDWTSPNQIKLRTGTGATDFKTDIGVGIRFTTPAFPVRLDWGYGFDHVTGERTYQINFGMGNLF